MTARARPGRAFVGYLFAAAFPAPMMRLLSLAAVALFAALPAAAQDASVVPDDAPEWLPMSDAIARAQADQKLILVHTYAAWCGWCARTDREVYTDDAVQAYLAEHFAATRLDLESPITLDFFGHTVSQAQLADAFGVTATPTTVFVSADGQPITKSPGFTDAATFRILLQYVVEEAYETEPFQTYLDRANGTEPALQLQQAVPDITPGG